MGRPRTFSRIQSPPRAKGFMPQGYYAQESEPLKLHVEEYEAIRLLDYENLSQEEAAVLMEVSRPTLTRIYDRARKKMAAALVECQCIDIEGGNAIYKGQWGHCNNCGSKFNFIKDREYSICPLCASKNIKKISELDQ